MRFEYNMEGFVGYYHVRRGVGHTKLMVEGLNAAVGDVMLVVHRIAYGESLKREIEKANPNVRIHLVTPDTADRLRGSRAPMAWDNAALMWLMEEAMSTIIRQNNEIAFLRKRLEDPETAKIETNAEQWAERVRRIRPEAFPEFDRLTEHYNVHRIFYPPGMKKCDKPDCMRLVRVGVLYCCPNCSLADEHKAQLADSNEDAHPLLKHTPDCDERYQQRAKEFGAEERERHDASPGADDPKPRSPKS